MKKSGNEKIIKSFFLFVFLLLACAGIIIGTQYAGNKTQERMSGKGFNTITFDEIKNSCINFSNMLP